MPDWLTQLRTDLEEITLPLARKYWPGLSPGDEPYFNFRLEQVKQVERDARRLLAAHDGDEDIVLASVWIHDRFRPQFEGEKHAARAAEWAEKNLVKTGFPADKVPAVVYAVANHSNPPQTIPETAKEARLLWDADKLFKVGALAVVYMLCGYPAFPGTKMSFQWAQEEIRSVLKQRKSLPSAYYFPRSRELGHERYRVLKSFCDALEKETGNSNSND